MTEQLALGLGLDKSLSFENFYPLPGNRLLLNQLQLQAAGEGEQWVYVNGGAESGRSHLLQASCQAAAHAGRQAAYLPLKELKDYSPRDLLAGVEQLDLLCLDDLDAVLGADAWEEALFHVYNRMSLSGSAMLVAAGAIATLPCCLPDLRSRLNSFSVYHLQGLKDEQKMQALRFRAESLGLCLNQDVVEYLYHRAPRNLGDLFACLDRLDRESLRQQRSLTKPFVKQIMKW